MLPRWSEGKITEAKYTELFDTGLKSGAYAVVLQNLQGDWEDFLDEIEVDHDVCDVIDEIIRKYRYYEINVLDKEGNKHETFIKCLEDTYYEHKEYFMQLAKAYFDTFNLNTAHINTIVRSDTREGHKQVITSASNESESSEYELPHKSVTPENVKGYLTGKTEGSGSASSTVGEGSNSSYGSTMTYNRNTEYLTLKRQFIIQLRNIAHEFADRFEDCFLQIY